MYDFLKSFGVGQSDEMEGKVGKWIVKRFNNADDATAFAHTLETLKTVFICKDLNGYFVTNSEIAAYCDDVEILERIA